MPSHDPKVYAAIDKTPMYDQEVDFGQDRSTNDLVIKRHQYIPDDFVAALKAAKMDSANTRSGEMLHVCSIPTSVIDDLKRLYNYDAMEEPIRQTIKLLKALHMDAFILTDKQI